MEGCITTKCKVGLSFGIILLFVLSAVAPISHGHNINIIGNIEQCSMSLSKGNILYVGGSGEGNYTTIQSAIDDAVDGDTVFVFDDSSPYYEWEILINKSINLIGEDRDTTVIDGNDKDIIIIDSNIDIVNISGFTIKYCDDGISTNWDSSNIVISNNHFLDCNRGITFLGVKYSNIVTNTFSNCVISIYNNDCENNRISNNIIIYNLSEFYDSYWDIECLHFSNNVIANNTFKNLCKDEPRDGLFLDGAGENIIEDNEFNGYSYIAIWTNMASNNIITHNTFINNWYGISFGFSSGSNRIINNNFIDNYNAASSFIFLKNIFDGNYWDEWIGLKIPILSFLPYFKFAFLGSVIDWHPAKEPYNYTTTQEMRV